MSASGCCGGDLARRSVLTAAVAGTATVGLAACAGATEPPAAPTAEPTQSGSASPTDPSPSESESAAAAATVLGAASAIEIGGGAKFTIGKDTVIVTQPQAGEFVGFDARCTHQGCVVTGVSDGEIRCGCHGARFDIASGEVRGGPAESPLKGVRISVVNDEIVLEN